MPVNVIIVTSILFQSSPPVQWYIIRVSLCSCVHSGLKFRQKKWNASFYMLVCCHANLAGWFPSSNKAITKINQNGVRRKKQTLRFVVSIVFSPNVSFRRGSLEYLFGRYVHILTCKIVFMPNESLSFFLHTITGFVAYHQQNEIKYFFFITCVWFVVSLKRFLKFPQDALFYPFPFVIAIFIVDHRYESELVLFFLPSEKVFHFLLLLNDVIVTHYTISDVIKSLQMYFIVCQ